MQLVHRQSLRLGERTCIEVALPIHGQLAVAPWNKQLRSGTYTCHFRNMSSTRAELSVESD
jgi:hypothetical protein